MPDLAVTELNLEFVVVVNTDRSNHLYEAGALNYLAIFAEVCVPAEVWRETVGQERVPEGALLDLAVRRVGALQDLPDFI